MGDDEELCNTRLQLGLGVGDQLYAPRQEIRKNKERPNLVCLDLSFALCPKEDVAANNLDNDHMENGSSVKKLIDEDNKEYTNDRKSSDQTNNMSMMNTNKNGARKKLRLTKEQSTLLEDSFKRHITLNPAQKEALAEQLNLKPRQVEVWFQNRRARTKLKQTEVDCEFLKKCCESLSDDNRRLRKELQELKSSPALCNNFQTIPKATMLMTMCPSCEKMVKANHHHKEEAAKK